jgi:hypothetical protein
VFLFKNEIVNTYIRRRKHRLTWTLLENFARAPHIAMPVGVLGGMLAKEDQAKHERQPLFLDGAS